MLRFQQFSQRISEVLESRFDALNFLKFLVLGKRNFPQKNGFFDIKRYLNSCSVPLC